MSENEANKDQPETAPTAPLTRWQRLAAKARIASGRQKVRWGASAVLALVIGASIGGSLLLARGSDEPEPAAPAGFSLSPEGTDVPRLTPVRVQFVSAPKERDPKQLLQIEPAAEGEYAWLDDRTVLFQPAYPGFLRGKEYAVTVAARPEAGLQQAVHALFVTEGPLTVDVVVPAAGEVEVPAGAQVLVQFSRSVAPLTVLSAQSTAPVVTFEPALPGKGEWLNTSLYRFVPVALAPDTTYGARIAAGLTSAVDGVLAQDYTWQFTTFGPAIDSFSVADNSLFAGLRQPLTVYFNQPMDRASVQAHLAFTHAATGAAVAGTSVWNEQGTALTFTPSGNLQNATAYTASLPAGLRSASGSLTKAGRTTTFQTVPLPAVASTSPANGSTTAGRYGLNISFVSPMDPDSFDGKVSVSGLARLEVDRALYVYDRQLSVSLSLRPSTTYTVSLAAGAKDRYGQVMGAYEFSFTTGALPPSLSFAIPSEVATFSASQEPFLFFHTTNKSSASFSLYRLTPEEARYLQVRNSIPTTGPDRFTPSQAPARQWTMPLENRADEVSVNSTSLSGGGLLAKGDYYVTSEGQGFGSHLAFSVVDTAIVLKQGSDALLVWAFDLDTGRPVAGSTVKADGEDVVGTKERTTDANGLVTFPLTALGPWQGRGLKVGVITLKAAGRYGVATPAWQRGIEPYRLGLPQGDGYGYGYGGGQRLVGHVYTDRAIYRPGEEVQFKAVVRTDDDAAYAIPPADVPVSFTIYSSQGKALLTDRVHLNEFGTFGSTFKLPADAETGSYGITLVWEASPNALTIAGSSFLVAEFRKPEFEVRVTTASPGYVSGETVEARTEAAFFFGGQVAGARVDWAATSAPFRPSFKGYERYSFADFDNFYRYDGASRNVVRDPTRATGTATTGADGTVAFSLPALIRGVEGPQEYTISATVIDINGQAVASSTKALVHPASLYAGVRAENVLASAGKASNLAVVTIDTKGAALPDTPVTIRVYERTWVTMKVATPGGGRSYRSEPVDTLIQSLTATTNARAEATVPLTPEHAGTLRVVAEVTDSKGRVAKSSTYLWVSSGEYVSWYVANDDSIQLIADREAYEVGDTAEILVPAPFAGATGLVTVERGKVHSARVQDFQTNSTVISVPITAQSVPNVYVSTVLYRPPTAADPVPRYKVGYVYLPVSTKTRVLNVAITADRPQAKPGDRVHYDIRVTDSQGRPVRAELSVAVVDKAVVSLAEERGPNGLRAFWFERGLGVQTASSLAVSVNRTNDVITEPRQGKGGSGGEDERLRQDFKNTALWLPQLATGADGLAGVDLTMPDNLTTWRMQVRAVSGDTLVGEGTNELLSTQPLLLRPALPRFVRVGDKLEVRMLVRNATPEAMDSTVTVESEGLDLPEKSPHAVRIGPGESKLVSWPATVTTEGRVKLTFRVKSGNGLADAIVQEFPAWLDVTPEAVATGGVVKDRPRSEALFLPSYAILERGSLEIAVQASLTGLLSSELTWFAPPPAPYEASEGTAGIAARIIATAGIMRAAKATGTDSAYKGQMDTDVARLVLRQNPDGGWRWCGNCSDSSPWITTWAVLAMAEAARSGKTIDPVPISRAESYLFGYLDRPADILRPRDADEKAQILYALAAAGRGLTTDSRLVALFEQERARLNTRGKGWLLLGMLAAGRDRTGTQVQALLGDIAAGIIPSANGNHWESGAPKAVTNRYGGSTDSISTTALVVQALTRIDPGHPLIEESVRWLMTARGARGWNAGTEGALALSALSEFAASTGELAGDYSFSVTADERKVLSGQLKGAESKVQSAKLPLTGFARGKSTILRLLRDFGAKGRMYYTLNLRYVTPAREVEALNRGLAVAHEYTALGDATKPISRAKVGDVVRVKVTVVAPADRNYVTVEDYLPGGFEPIDASLKTSDPALVRKLQDDRTAAQQRGQEGAAAAPWYRWYWSPFREATLRDDRVVLRATTLPKGVHEYVYYVRATTPGDFFVAPAHAGEGQSPEVFGRSDSGRFVVEP